MSVNTNLPQERDPHERYNAHSHGVRHGTANRCEPGDCGFFTCLPLASAGAAAQEKLPGPRFLTYLLLVEHQGGAP